MGGLREKSDKELIHDLLDHERQLMADRMKHSANQLENTAGLRALRRSIARLHTEARRREIEQGLRKDTLLHTHRQTYASGAAPERPGGGDKGGFLAGIVDKLAGQD